MKKFCLLLFHTLFQLKIVQYQTPSTQGNMWRIQILKVNIFSNNIFVWHLSYFREKYLFHTKGCQKEHSLLEISSKSFYMIINHHFKYLYDKIYTIGYYSGFYSSLKDNIWANCGHFEFSSKDGEECMYVCMYVCIKSICKSWLVNVQ